MADDLILCIWRGDQYSYLKFKMGVTSLPAWILIRTSMMNSFTPLPLQPFLVNLIPVKVLPVVSHLETFIPFGENESSGVTSNSLSMAWTRLRSLSALFKLLFGARALATSKSLTSLGGRFKFISLASLFPIFADLAGSIVSVAAVSSFSSADRITLYW